MLTCAHPPRQIHTTSIRSNKRASWSRLIGKGHSPLLLLGAQPPLGGRLKWGNTSISSWRLVCKCTVSASSTTTACASPTTSSLLAASTTLSRVENTLSRSRKWLLPHVLHRGDVKLRVWGGGGCCECHRCHSLLDGHLVCRKLVNCQVISKGIVAAPPYVFPRVLPVVKAAVCFTVFSLSTMLMSSLSSCSDNTLNMLLPPGTYPCCPVVIQRARDRGSSSRGPAKIVFFRRET